MTCAVISELQVAFACPGYLLHRRIGNVLEIAGSHLDSPLAYQRLERCHRQPRQSPDLPESSPTEASPVFTTFQIRQSQVRVLPQWTVPQENISGFRAPSLFVLEATSDVVNTST